MDNKLFTLGFIKFFIILVIFIVFLFLFLNEEQHSKQSTICNKSLSDNEYLKHMITHHQVAVDMSEKHLNNTHNPQILNILRNIIRIQTYEINMMKDALSNSIPNPEHPNMFNDEMSDETIQMDNSYYYTQNNFTHSDYPHTPYVSNTFCDPSFFDTSYYNNHNNHNNHMTDDEYLKHMIPHHQVAVDMSKRILQTTTNDFIIYLAYRIIKSQVVEIYELDNITKTNYRFNSTLL